MSVAAGTVITGRYEILDRIADGGMSTVYRARRLPDGPVVALKILRSQYAADREFIERFSREARAAEALEHPNIVKVFESGRDGEVHFIAMEYIDGPDLKDRLRRVGPFDPRDAEHVTRAVCEALEYAHRQGIVHRDIKPQNILIAPDGTVKVADFGIARALAAVTITEPGTVLGTVQYLSPEQARGGAVGRASDLYALGAVLYEMLTGRLPYDGDAPIAIVLKHLHDPPPRARAARPDVPPRLEGIVLKAMAKAPSDRYRSARDMATDLDGETEFWRDAVEDEGTTRQFRMAPAAPGRRIMRLGPAQASVLAAALAVLGIWSAWRAFNAYLTVPEVEMPALIGRPLQDAEAAAKAAGVTVEVTDRINSPTVPVDVVISQDQPPGKRLKQGRRVGLVVSLGARMVTVPDLTQRSFVEAQLMLDAARLKLGMVKDGYDTVARPDLVLRQDPAPGASVPVDSPVTLVVSRGPPVIEMPELVGRTLEEARRLLGEKGLTIAHLRTVGTTQAAPGIVLEQTPSPGVSVRFGEVMITLTVSARPGDESAPPSAPVITAEPQPVESEGPPSPSPRPRESPRPAPSAPAPRLTASPGPVVKSPAPVVPGQPRRTRIQVVVPEGGTQDVKIVVIDERGVRTVYQAPHAPGDRIDQIVRSQGYTIIQVYIGNQLVEEVRP